LSCKSVNRYKYTSLLMPDEGKHFGGSLVSDFRE